MAFEINDKVVIISSRGYPEYNSYIGYVVDIDRADENLKNCVSIETGYEKEYIWFADSELIINSEVTTKSVITKWAAEIRRIQDEGTAGDFTYEWILSECAREVAATL